MKKLSDLDKNMKVRHLQGRQVKLTCNHVGIKREKKKSEMLFVAGGELPDDYEETVFLYWKEWGSKFPLMLNATNREFIIKAFGDTDKWATQCIDKVFTMEMQKHIAFKKEFVAIIAIDAPKAAPTDSAKKPAAETPNKETGELPQTSKTFWALADQKKMKPEASALVTKYTTNGITGKTTDWNGAYAELLAVSLPELQPA